MASKRNPYIAGIPVGNQVSFVGREDILRETMRVLEDQNQNAITLFGQRRIGKTSILQYLATHLPKEGDFDAVFFDLEDRAAKPLDQVIIELAKSIAIELGFPTPNLGKDPVSKFRDTWLPQSIEKMKQKARSKKENSIHSLVLLFDEFDVLADPQAGTAAKDFFPYLRSLLSLDRTHLQFIFTLGRNLGDLSQVAISLFKGVPDKRVSLLSKPDTEILIRISENENTLNWNPDAIEKVWSLTNGHPFLTQALCWQIWQNKHENTKNEIPIVDVSDVDNAVNLTLDRNRNALDWLWQGLGPAEKVVAASLAQAGKGVVTQEEIENLLNDSGVVIIIRELREEAPKRLQEWDLIEPADGGYCFRVELLRLWIADRFPLSLVQKELDNVQPAAESFYQGARTLYQANDLKGAKSALIQATGFNPNHRGASELLAEIYIVEGELDKAQSLLENLFRTYPAVARPRLIQVYLSQAEKSSDDEKKLEWYQKVLEISPSQSSAQAAISDIWSSRGEFALKSNNYKDALSAFKKAGNEAKISEVLNAIQELEIQKNLDEILKLESDQQYNEALDLAKKIDKKYKPGSDWGKILERLQTKNRLANSYQQALGAISQGDQQKAINLLLEVLSIQPDYEDAAYQLNKVVAESKKKKSKITSEDQTNKTENDTAEIKSQSISNEAALPGISVPTRKKNPIDFVRFFFWILFAPDQRKKFVEKYGSESELFYTKWIKSTVTILPAFYINIGLLIGEVTTDFISLSSAFMFALTTVMWLILGLSKSKDDEEQNITFGLLSFVLLVAILITPADLRTLLFLFLLTVTASAIGKALVSSNFTNTISALMFAPVFSIILFLVWYVAKIWLTGIIGIIAGVITFFASLLIIGTLSLIIKAVISTINERSSLKSRSSWATFWFFMLHGTLIWIIFFGGLQIIDGYFKTN
jgi:Tfp pilus assembly protein PilF